MKVAIKVRRIMSHVRIDKSENAAPSKIFIKKWGSCLHTKDVNPCSPSLALQDLSYKKEHSNWYNLDMRETQLKPRWFPPCSYVFPQLGRRHGS
jgi:hypothetical protein